MNTQISSAKIIEGLSQVIQGKRDQIELFTAAFFAGGHVLIEDYPGLGKTTLARSLAALVASGTDNDRSATFSRIQFTPDLLPYDITGVDVFNSDTHSFDFIPGPVFSDILLADEINRTTPKVQSALLEVMAERQVTQGGKTRKVSPVFFVVATQNPVETEGTYPLPAAQLDRFMMRLSLGYPDFEAEAIILKQDPEKSILPTLSPVLHTSDLLFSREEQKTVWCHPALERMILSFIRKTRIHKDIKLGASPRGALLLLHAARALALIRGRNWIEDTDIFDLSGPILAHRLVPKNSSSSVPLIITDILESCFSEMNKNTDWTREAYDSTS